MEHKATLLFKKKKIDIRFCVSCNLIKVKKKKNLDFSFSTKENPLNMLDICKDNKEKLIDIQFHRKSNKIRQQMTFHYRLNFLFKLYR